MANYTDNEISVITKVPVEEWTLEGSDGERVLSFEKIFPCTESDEALARIWKDANWGRKNDIAYEDGNGYMVNYEGYYEKLDETVHQFSISTQWTENREFVIALAKFLSERDASFEITDAYEMEDNFAGRIVARYDATKKEISIDEIFVDGLPPKDWDGNYVYANANEYDIVSLKKLGKNAIRFNEWKNQGRDDSEVEDMMEELGIEDEEV